MLHKNEINYAVVAPRGVLAPLGVGEFRAVFDCIGTALAASLRGMGFEPELHSGNRGTISSQHGLCGRSITGNEVSLHGLKIIAAAQMITPSSILQHGTIYLKAPGATDRFWPLSKTQGESKDFVQRWTDLGPTFADSNRQEIVSLLDNSFRRHLPVDCGSCDMSSDDWAAVESILDRWAATRWSQSR